MPSITIPLPDNLAARLMQEAQHLNLSPEEYVVHILKGSIAPAHNLNQAVFGQGLEKLHFFIQQVPAITDVTASASTEPYWWIKFRIDIHHNLAWQVIQELGFVLNDLSIEEQFPTVFKPISPPPYLNGGPEQFLSWEIETTQPFLDAGYVADMLEGRLPRPVYDEQEWQLDDESNDI